MEPRRRRNVFLYRGNVRTAGGGLVLKKMGGGISAEPENGSKQSITLATGEGECWIISVLGKKGEKNLAGGGLQSRSL